jgi:hypothetical protein
MTSNLKSIKLKKNKIKKITKKPKKNSIKKLIKIKKRDHLLHCPYRGSPN